MNNPYRLDQKTALITGGAQGIGYGIAKEFIHLGARVAITGRNAKKLQHAQSELGEHCFIYESDVTDKKKHSSLVDKIEKEAGPIDILVNNAGIHLKKPALEITDEEFQKLMDVNLNSAFALTRTVLKRMLVRKMGSVIFISSMAALYGLSQVAAYASAKSALLGLAMNLASDYSNAGIRFNVLAPGYIESKMFLNAINDDPERKAKILSRTPAGHFGKPEDVARAAAFLASDASSYVTGVCLPVDGGNSIGF